MERVDAAGRRYSVVLVPEPEEGGYSVLVPALPGCYTQGETVAEALANAREAIRGTSRAWRPTASRCRSSRPRGARGSSWSRSDALGGAGAGAR